MSRKLFLTSQFYHVSGSIGQKISNDLTKQMVFINTPLTNKKYSDLELDWHYKNIENFEKLGIQFDLYDITGKTEHDIKTDLAKYEIMYIEGGNLFYLLQQARKNNFGQYISDRVSGGMIYISTSAGSVIAGPDISSTGRPGKSGVDFGLTDTTGFNLVNFSISPHWGDPKKKEMYTEYKIPQSYHEDYPYIMLADTQYIEVVGEKFKIIDVTIK